MDIRRIYVKAVMNGFHVELDDHVYNEEVYVYTSWEDVLACLSDKAPIIKSIQQGADPAPKSIN